MKPVMIVSGVFNIIFNPAVHIRVADGVPDVMAEIAAHIRNGLFSLLAGLDLG
jgi:hypothetical protein